MTVVVIWATLGQASSGDQDMRDVAQVSEQLLKNPSKLHQAIRKEKSASSSIYTLNVGSRTFTGNNVCDGFFDSLSSLKEPDMSSPTVPPSQRH